MTPRIHHLSSLDASFLHIESAEMPMHVGSVHLLEAPAGRDGEFFEAVKAHVASRLHLAPVFTRKLALMPFELSNPVWVDDEFIDLDHHLRRVVLPRPGSWEQLERVVARLHSSLLDRSRPLWEFTVIEGLQSGEVVLYAKAHHAGIDGQAGQAVGRALFDPAPHGRVVRSPRRRPRSNRYQLGMAELVAAALGNTVRQSAGLVRSVPDIARGLKSLVVPQPGPDGRRRWFARNLQVFGPKTPFNAAITNQRNWAARSVSLAEARAIAFAVGGTVNDVVLATCSGAMRRYLAEYDALPARPMSAAVPVSLRAEGDTRADNQVSMMLMTLASNVDDPLERLLAIVAASKKTKRAMGAASAALPLDFPLLGAPWLMSGLASLYGRTRLVNVMPPLANVVVSNVAGPPAEVYFAGARMRSFYPVSIPAHGMALNITVHSYDGDLDYGLTACRRAVPDLGDLGYFIVAEHQVLAQCVQRLRAPGGSDDLQGAGAPSPPLVGTEQGGEAAPARDEARPASPPDAPPAATRSARPRSRGAAAARGDVPAECAGAGV
ncbi:MAG: wax ester/triacylglycerol synthase family O-acyltransferase [Burkholderiales bacterium]|nr:wax ester/triacylglycerol synthase family O-acyltransferase [Burkholderiales bacterium]